MTTAIPKDRRTNNNWEEQPKKTTTKTVNHANNANTRKSTNIQDRSNINKEDINKTEKKARQYTGKSEAISKKLNENRENDRLKNNLNVTKTDEISIDKTADILKQVNEYLDKQKESLK